MRFSHVKILKIIKFNVSGGMLINADVKSCLCRKIVNTYVYKYEINNHKQWYLSSLFTIFAI